MSFSGTNANPSLINTLLALNRSTASDSPTWERGKKIKINHETAKKHSNNYYNPKIQNRLVRL